MTTARLVIRHMNYSATPIDTAVIRDHRDVADLYLAAGVIRRQIDVRDAFDFSLFK